MKVFCILSDERAFRSKSPAMHSAVLKQVGINGIYVPFKVDSSRIEQAIKGLKALNISGANVTVPYKQAVMPYLDSISDEAKAIGAVNTIVYENDILKGYNTDAAGFIDALSLSKFNPLSKSFIVFGTGGAVRAILFALKKYRALSVVIAGRNKEKTNLLANEFGVTQANLDELQNVSLNANCVINATSVSSPEESKEMADFLDKLDINSCELVVDINYGRKVNFWNMLANRLNVAFTDGLPMLAGQARKSFMLWTGVEPDLDIFLKQLL